MGSMWNRYVLFDSRMRDGEVGVDGVLIGFVVVLLKGHRWMMGFDGSRSGYLQIVEFGRMVGMWILGRYMRRLDGWMDKLR